jgi:UPF0042 nucleotide-binding protein
MSTPPKLPQRVVLITGPSGAGRSTAIKALEDLEYEVIDNLPLSLWPRLLDGPPPPRPLALGLDVRNRDFSTQSVIEMVEQVSGRTNLSVELLYLECSTDVLMRRFSETRRRHPMAPEESPIQGITREHDMLAPLRSRADVLVDTSTLSPHDLKAELGRLFGAHGGSFLAVSLNSFSYKRGLPRGMDMVFDCRFLNNPYWDPKLRQMSGMDQAVQNFVAKDARFDEFFAQIQAMIEFLLPAYREEGKAHFSVGFGCTGGQHRSVTLTEKLAQALAEQDWQVSIRHREMGRRETIAALGQKE